MPENNNPGNSGDAKVALSLFHIYVDNLTEEEAISIYKSKKQLLKTYAEFLFAVRYPDYVINGDALIKLLKS